MISAFTSVLHVPNLSQPDHVISVLEQSEVFTKSELASIADKLKRNKYVVFLGFCYNFLFFLASVFMAFFLFRVFVGIKKVLALIDMVKQVEDGFRVPTFLTKLEEEADEYWTNPGLEHHNSWLRFPFQFCFPKDMIIANWCFFLPLHFPYFCVLLGLHSIFEKMNFLSRFRNPQGGRI